MIDLAKWKSTDPIIIGICGEKQSGKTSLANTIDGTIQDSFVVPLAGPLKSVCDMLFGISGVPDTDDHKNALSSLRYGDVNFNLLCLAGIIDDTDIYASDARLTNRQVWQIVGTELLRNNFRDVWVNALMRDIDDLTSIFSIFVVPDVRFADEAQRILEEPGGWIVHLTRKPPCSGTDTHVSEQQFAKIREAFKMDRKYLIFDNAGMTVKEQGKKFMETLFNTIVVNTWETVND